MEKTFSKIQIAAIKRTAQNVSTFVTKKEKLNAQIDELKVEISKIQPLIDAFQGPIKEMTGGYTTEDLITREVVHTGKMNTKTGKEILQTRFVLKYPETIIPVAETSEAPAADEYAADNEVAEEVVASDPFGSDDSWQ